MSEKDEAKVLSLSTRQDRDAAIAALWRSAVEIDVAVVERWLDEGGASVEDGHGDTRRVTLFGTEFHVAEAIAKARAEGYAVCQADCVVGLRILEMRRSYMMFGSTAVLAAANNIENGTYVGAAAELARKDGAA